MNEALMICGELAELAVDLERPACADRTIELLNELDSREMTSVQRAQRYFFEGYSWAAKDAISHRRGDSIWNWTPEPVERAIRAFRRARREPGLQLLPEIQRSRVLLSLANELSTIGRVVAACAVYEEAVRLSPRFGTALGNRSIALRHYANYHYDPIHFAILRWYSNSEGVSALGLQLEPGMEPNLRSSLEKTRADGAPPGFFDNPLPFHAQRLSEVPDEVVYREWCLEHRLYLNSLNDCTTESIAADDVLHLPTIIRPIGEGPGFHGFFNQIKQEYVSARFLLFEATRARAAHPSDRNVYLVDTLDSPSYGLAVEKLRIAFRVAFSILDKVAVFMARYFELDKAERTSFRTVWYVDGDLKKGPRPEFVARPNWPLRGLFWLSKDFSKGMAANGDYLDPDAHELLEIRNQLEHGYVKIVSTARPDMVTRGPLRDQQAIVCVRDDFEQQALHVLRHAREAQIYLTLGLHRESREMAAERSQSVPVMFTPIQDDMKR